MKRNVHIIYCALLILFCGIATNNCDYYKDYGRGYRYNRGGNYFGSDPSFSPDSKQIVFGSIQYGLGDIYSINIDGTDIRRLTVTDAYEGEPEFSPDGSKIVFISERENPAYGKIFIMNSDGTNQKQLTFGKGYDFGPSFSPDGKKIVFVRQIERYISELFVVDINGTNLRMLTHDEKPKSTPYFSKKEKICYKAYNYETQRNEIYEISEDGLYPILILQLGKNEYDARFSPDGEKVVYILQNSVDYSTEISIMRADGKYIKQLTASKTAKDLPTFSPDGKKIVFLSREKDGRGKGQIMIMNTDGSDLKVVANNY
jgi:Tol biopolymer transport system component